MKIAMLCKPADQVGKVFVAEAFGIRRCLICDQGYTREEAAKHAKVACRPRECNDHKSRQKGATE